MNKKIMQLLAVATLCPIMTWSAVAGTSTAPSSKQLDKAVTSVDTMTPLEKWWNGDYLTGDWFGARTSLENYGIRPFGSWESELAYNWSGGSKEGGFDHVASFEFGVEFDMEKLAGWRGGSIFTRAVYRTGDSLTRDYVGNYYDTQQISSGPITNSSKLWLQDFYIQQKFLKDKNLTLQVGRMAVSDQFGTSPIYGLYQNNAMDGNPKSLVTTSAFSCYPGSVWGGNLQYVDSKKQWYGKLGLYQANNRLYDPYVNDHGVDLGVRDGDGIMAITEWGWTPEFNKKAVTVYDDKGKAHTEMHGMPGHYWIGGFVSTMDSPYYVKTNGYNPVTGGMKDFQWAVYLNADQMIYQAEPGTDKGLSVWATFDYEGPESVWTFPWQVAGGVFYKGLIPSRDNDIIMFGFTYGSFSDYNTWSPNGYAKEQGKTIITTQKPDAETVLEVGYRVQMNKFFWFQPNVQYIIDPGGVHDIPDAWILGCRIGATF